MDTNILISMLFFPSETTKRFKDEVVKHQIILCDYVIREMQLVTERKFPHRREALDYFFVAYTPRDIRKGIFTSVRDEKDSPIPAQNELSRTF